MYKCYQGKNDSSVLHLYLTDLTKMRKKCETKNRMVLKGVLQILII